MEKDVYELTNAQKSIWNTELFYNGSNINNICGTINIFEPLDINALKEALHLIVAENDNLHAQFYIKDGCIYQSFKKDLDYNIDVLEISSKTDLRKLERKMRSHIFDILHSDLFDFKIFKYPDSTGGVVVNIHHLISDSWTLGLIAKNIIKKYYSISHNIPMETNKASYIDYINYEQKYLSSNKFQKDKEFWQNYLENRPDSITMPTFKKKYKTKLFLQG